MYPTVVIALIYSQRSMTDNYDLGLVSTTLFRIAHVAPPTHDTYPLQSVTGDAARAGEEERP